MDACYAIHSYQDKQGEETLQPYVAAGRRRTTLTFMYQHGRKEEDSSLRHLGMASGRGGRPLKDIDGNQHGRQCQVGWLLILVPPICCPHWRRSLVPLHTHPLPGSPVPYLPFCACHATLFILHLFTLYTPALDLIPISFLCHSCPYYPRSNGTAEELWGERS